MRLEHLHYLLTVAECQSINKASARLFVNQQNLSKLIAALEEEFGVVIFTRSYKGVSPTVEGEKILAWARLLETTYQQLMADITPEQQPLQGELSISAIINLFSNVYTDILDGFATRYPHVTIAFEEKSTPSIIQDICQDSRLIGIISRDPSQLAHEPLPPELVFLPAYSTHLAVYTAKNSPLAKKYQSISLKSLLTEPFVIYKPYETSHSLVQKALAPYGSPHIQYAVSNLNTFFGLLKKGKGITLGVKRLYTGKQLDDLATIPIRDSPPIQLGLLIDHRSQEDPLCKAFCDFYLAYFQHLL